MGVCPDNYNIAKRGVFPIFYYNITKGEEWSLETPNLNYVINGHWAGPKEIVKTIFAVEVRVVFAEGIRRGLAAKVEDHFDFVLR